MKLIKIQDKFILVSDEKVSSIQPEYYYCNKDLDWYKFSEDMIDDLEKEDRPIIAGIPELPSIDFSDLKEEDCKEIGFIDVEELAYKYLNDNYEYVWDNGDVNNWLDGFKTAQSLNDKMFSLETILSDFYVYATNGEVCKHGVINEFIQSLQQTSWDVEVEMEDKIAIDGHTVIGRELKITNNSIKVLRIL